MNKFTLIYACKGKRSIYLTAYAPSIEVAIEHADKTTTNAEPNVTATYHLDGAYGMGASIYRKNVGLKGANDLISDLVDALAGTITCESHPAAVRTLEEGYLYLRWNT